ncbi:MAG: 23S rRNA (uracil(1939)-C(5))-methyltransferase RlmD [Cyclobacteriaceae bacterium]|nr:23S rRNA (uracil(1939)-C(5))-methyltransferase RlmD [Cyclobacteriaceae bacterium]
MKKGDRLQNIAIDTMGAEGKCVAKVNGQVLFLQGGAPGDTVEVELTKIKSNYLEGRVVSIQKLSPHRSEPFCEHFGLCGGCVWQHINYATQLHYKQQQVADNLEHIGGLTLPPLTPILGSAQTQHYRNKLDFTFTSGRWLTHQELDLKKNQGLEPLPSGRYPDEPGLGFHIPRMYDRVFDVHTCYLQPQPSNSIRLLARKTAIENNIPFFDLRKQVGFLRTLTLRTTTTGEVMVILQVTYNEMKWITLLLQTLTDAFPQITSANYIINSKRNDTFADLDVICWKGNPYITEQMPKPEGHGTLQFRIGPKSFYQTNPHQAYQLYKVAWQLADLKGTEHVYDLYTGTGTIANFVAAHARQVIGLEYVAAAIDDARINATINHITNTRFYAGDMKDLLTENFLTQHGRPDVVITDPPRAGMHEDVTRLLLHAAPARIVYVSCNAATQARDLKILSEKYTLTAVQPVDMFPQTMHVENVVRLDLK